MITHSAKEITQQGGGALAPLCQLCKETLKISHHPPPHPYYDKVPTGVCKLNDVHVVFECYVADLQT